jgi:hypothetical protein
MKQDELTTIFNLFIRIAELSSSCWTDPMKDLDGNDLPPTTINNYKFLVNKTRFRPITVEEIEKQKKFIEKKQLVRNNRDTRTLFLDYLYLPPLDDDRDFIPLISARITFAFEIPNLSLRVGMFDIQNGHSIFFGFRFETGHFGKKSEHDFCHGQLAKEPFGDTNTISSFSGLPQHYPAVLMPARCPGTLILCMLFSMYGLKIQKTSIFHELKLGVRYKIPFEFLGYSIRYPTLSS